MHFMIAPNFPLPPVVICALTVTLLPTTSSPWTPQQLCCLCSFIIFLLSSFLQIGLLSLTPHVCHFVPKKMSPKPRLTLVFPEQPHFPALHPLFDCGCLRQSWLNWPPPLPRFFPGALCYLWLSSYFSCDLLPSVLRAPFNSPSALCFYLTSSIPSLLTVAGSRECLKKKKKKHKKTWTHYLPSIHYHIFPSSSFLF